MLKNFFDSITRILDLNKNGVIDPGDFYKGYNDLKHLMHKYHDPIHHTLHAMHYIEHDTKHFVDNFGHKIENCRHDWCASDDFFNGQYKETYSKTSYGDNTSYNSYSKGTWYDKSTGIWYSYPGETS